MQSLNLKNRPTSAGSHGPNQEAYAGHVSIQLRQSIPNLLILSDILYELVDLAPSYEAHDAAASGHGFHLV